MYDQNNDLLTDQNFAQNLYKEMIAIIPGLSDLELYEFIYALENLHPQEGWSSIHTESMRIIEAKISTLAFFRDIQVKPFKAGKIQLDPEIGNLTVILMVGMVKKIYPLEWVNKYFYFDIRGFYFLVRTRYLNEKVISHLNNKPYCSFPKKQQDFETCQAIGYKEFSAANQEIDQKFLEIVDDLFKIKQKPVVLAIAGPTAAGKTEIVEQLSNYFEEHGESVTTLELDNFLTDRDYREAHGIDSLGKEALHFELFCQSFQDLLARKETWIPQYDFIHATSSHDLSGNLKDGFQATRIAPADIIFVEGNSPFLLPEIAKFIALKVVYLTDDPIRMKRKWRRDMDLRKKYDLNYFRNRYFKDQFLMAEQVFIPQMEVCDLLVDTTSAQIWVTEDIWLQLSEVPAKE